MNNRSMGNQAIDYNPDELTAVWMVVIEWDGDKPPTVYYNRIRKMGFTVRGDKSTSPLTRRAGFEGVVYQEGNLICRAESTARFLSGLASEYGARAVSIIRATFASTTMSESDARTLESMQAYFGAKGRRANPVKWCVTCKDEGKSYTIETDKPVVCPNCGSLEINYRQGDKPAYMDQETINPRAVWIGSRFGNGLFESPVLSNDPIDGYTNPPTNPTINTGDQTRIDHLMHSTLIDQLNRLADAKIINRAGYLAALDAGYCVLTKNNDTRAKSRIESIARFFARGGDANELTLITNPLDVDMIDLYPVMGETAIENTLRYDHLMNH